MPFKEDESLLVNLIRNLRCFDSYTRIDYNLGLSYLQGKLTNALGKNLELWFDFEYLEKPLS